MATKEAKAEQKLIKARAKEERKELKALEKADRKEIKAESKVVRKRVQSHLKAQKKPAKVAHKEVRKEANRLVAVQQVRKLPQRFQGIKNNWVRLIIVLLAYNWFRSNWEKERQKRDIREARTFLHEWRSGEHPK